LNVKLYLLVVHSIFDFLQLNNVLETEAQGGFVLDQGFEDLPATVLSRRADRGDFLDVEDLVLDFQAHHRRVGVLGLSLRLELYVHGALELTGDGIIDNVDVFDNPEDFADLLNHGHTVSLWKVHNLNLRVQARHHLRVLVDNLALAEGLLDHTGRGVFLLAAVGAYGYEVGVTAHKLTGRRDDARRVLRSAYFKVLEKGRLGVTRRLG